MRVLLVEDDPVTAKTIALTLSAENLSCDTTDLGVDGVAIGKRDGHDIILLDLLLPDIDGYEVLRQLRLAKVQTPVVILSGLGDLEYKIKGLACGADDFLTKPVERRDLVARLQTVVRQAKRAGGSVSPR